MRGRLAARRSQRKLLAGGATVIVFASIVLSLRFPSGATPTSGPQAMRLSGDLRARVEQLKRDVAAQPTTPETLSERTNVLWDWANAYALQGGTLPVELPLTVGMVRGFPGGRGGPANWSRTLDRYVRELQIRDESPEAIGTLESDTRGPFEAGSYQTIRQTYTVGRLPLVPGAGLLVAKHFAADHAPFQSADPSADNYVTIASSDPNARFQVESTPILGMHGGLFAPVDTLVFRLVGPAVASGETITVTYGDRSGGSRGFRLQTYANDRFPLPLYVDLEGQGNFFTLPIVPLRIVGNEVHAVHGFAPSIVKTGEPFEISVRSEDALYNRASGPIPAYRVVVNGKPLREIPASDDAITVLKDLKFDEPGVYRFTFSSADGSVQGVANPILVHDDPEQRLYWGETHGHSGFSEAQGTPDAFFQFGRDEARLDFLTHSEHDLWMDDYEWEVLKENVRKYNEEGKFIAILGYEWTMRAAQGGHHNVFFRTADGRQRVPVQEAPVLSELYRRLTTENDADDVLVIPHAHEPGDYRYSHPQVERLVEVMSMHGRHEWFGQEYLKRGHQVGFVAASDDHLSHPGYATPTNRGLADSGGLAAVWATEKTTDAVFAALRNRQTYATTGERIIVDFKLNGTPMGQRLEYAPERKLQVHVIGTGPLDSVTIVKNGRDLWSQEFASAEPTSSRRHAMLTFASDSDPIIRDSPRAWREWAGTIRIEGAKLAKLVSHSFNNPRSERIEPVAGDANGLRFAALTRGSQKALVLDLGDASRDAAIAVNLEPTVERYSTPSPLRRAAEIPGTKFKLRMSQAEAGSAIERIPVGRYTDTVSLRLIKPDVPLDAEIEFADSDAPEHGDYYYVRVRQLNGGMAWSSPIWVGGYPSR